MKAMTESSSQRASDTHLIHVYGLCAQWCGTCREYQPVFDALARQMSAARFVWVDVETHDDLMGDLDIENFPTLLITDAQGHPRFAGTVLPHADTLQRMCQAALAGDFAVIQEASWQSVAKGLMQLPA